MPECSAASVGPRFQKHGHQEDVWEASPRYASSAVLEARLDVGAEGRFPWHLCWSVQAHSVWLPLGVEQRRRKYFSPHVWHADLPHTNFSSEACSVPVAFSHQCMGLRMVWQLISLSDHSYYEFSCMVSPVPLYVAHS